MATTNVDLARTFTPPGTEAEVTMRVERVNGGRTYVLYAEIQPAIGGMVRGVASWEGTGVPTAAEVQQLRQDVYADLIANARHYRIQHGSGET